MSTRSRIAIELPDGKVKSIYCHNDGYLDHNGRILNNFYTDREKVRALIKLGDISSLSEEISPTGPHSFSNPQGGVIPHCRGVAIDLTVTENNEKELEMGSDFDEFSDLAFHSCDKISKEARKNRLILLGIMTNAGFDFYQQEWWHYQLFNSRQYPIIEADSTMIPNLNFK